MNILYVEDNKADIELTRKELGKSSPDIHLQTVNTIQDAKKVIKDDNNHKLDLVLSDMHLPDGDGLNFLDWIRENDYPFAVVLITGHGDEETAVAALKAGVDDYIAKTPGYLKKDSLQFLIMPTTVFGQRPPENQISSKFYMSSIIRQI